MESGKRQQKNGILFSPKRTKFLGRDIERSFQRYHVGGIFGSIPKSIKAILNQQSADLYKGLMKNCLTWNQVISRTPRRKAETRCINLGSRINKYICAFSSSTME